MNSIKERDDLHPGHDKWLKVTEQTKSILKDRLFEQNDYMKKSKIENLWPYHSLYFDHSDPDSSFFINRREQPIRVGYLVGEIWLHLYFGVI